MGTSALCDVSANWVEVESGSMQANQVLGSRDRSVIMCPQFRSYLFAN